MDLERKIDVAKTGRSKCRGCQELIEKDELRFGEEVVSRFGDGGDIATMWYHLPCAAEKRPKELRSALASHKGKIPGMAALEQKMKTAPGSAKGAAFPYAEKAPTSRSKCLSCEKTIEKETARVVVEREVEIAGFMRTSPGYLHPGCAKKFTGNSQLAKQLKTNSTALPPKELAAMLKQL